MGNNASIKKLSYEDIQIVQKNKKYILINTLPNEQQECLISGTIDIQKEVSIINNSIKNAKNISIVIYGMNNNDESIYKKHDQLKSLGFSNVYVYIGGLFEWLLLQDIYGKELFSTTSEQLDLLKFRSRSFFSTNLLLNE